MIKGSLKERVNKPYPEMESIEMISGKAYKRFDPFF